MKPEPGTLSGAALTTEDLVHRPLEPVERCRRPQMSGPGWEVQIARSNQKLLEGASADVENRLPGIIDGINGAWGSAPVLLDPGAADALLPGIGGLDEVAALHHLADGRLTASRDGEDLTVAAENLGFGVSRPSLQTISAVLAQRACVTVRGVEAGNHSLAPLFRSLDRVVGQTCRCDVTLCGVGASLRLPPTDEFVLVLSVDATVGLVTSVPSPASGTNPLPSHHHLKAHVPCVVPPGRHVSVEADDGATVMTVVLPRLLGLGLARSALGEAVWWPLLRADVPVARDGSHDSYAGSVFDSADAFGDALAPLVSDDALDRLIARSLAARAPRMATTLSATIAAGIDPPHAEACVRTTITGGIQILDTEGRASTTQVHLCAAGRVVSGDEHAIALLSLLGDGADHCVADISLAVGPHGGSHIPAMIGTLMKIGLVEASP